MSEILNRAVTKGREPGAAESMTPVYFHRKQKENENKKNSLASFLHFPTY